MKYNLYDYNVRVFFDKEDGDYIAAIDEIQGCSAFGDSPAEALKELETGYEAWLQTSLENSFDIPTPAKYDKNLKKFELELPGTLQKQIFELAKEDNVPLSQEVIYYLKLGLSASIKNKLQNTTEIN